MTKKQQIQPWSHSMASFIPLTCVTLCQFYSVTSPVLFTKITNYEMREKKIFCMYSCFNVSRDIKEGRKSYHHHRFI